MTQTRSSKKRAKKKKGKGLLGAASDLQDLQDHEKDVEHKETGLDVASMEQEQDSDDQAGFNLPMDNQEDISFAAFNDGDDVGADLMNLDIPDIQHIEEGEEEDEDDDDDDDEQKQQQQQHRHMQEVEEDEKEDNEQQDNDDDDDDDRSEETKESNSQVLMPPPSPQQPLGPTTSSNNKIKPANHQQQRPKTKKKRKAADQDDDYLSSSTPMEVAENDKGNDMKKTGAGVTAKKAKTTAPEPGLNDLWRQHKQLQQQQQQGGFSSSSSSGDDEQQDDDDGKASSSKTIKAPIRLSTPQSVSKKISAPQLKKKKKSKSKRKGVSPPPIDKLQPEQASKKKRGNIVTTAAAQQQAAEISNMVDGLNERTSKSRMSLHAMHKDSMDLLSKAEEDHLILEKASSDALQMQVEFVRLLNDMNMLNNPVVMNQIQSLEARVQKTISRIES